MQRVDITFLWPLYAVLAMTFLAGCKMPSKDTKDWQLYKGTFIGQEGRVVDTGNKGVSHSEGQGYGMLLALENDDRKTFQGLWQWTRKNLQTRNDYLFSWCFEPGKGVTDKNNATDGDVLIAWALLQAGKEWGDKDYLLASKNILKDIRNKLVRNWQDLTILLPGEYGFEKNAGFTVNLSYWVFPAFLEFQTFDPSPLWDELIKSGLILQGKARFGRWQLPPDWLDLAVDMKVSIKYQPVSGYDAIRIPLYLLWAGKMSMEVAQRRVEFYRQSIEQTGYVSPTVNLFSDELAKYPAPKGIIQIYHTQKAFINKDLVGLENSLRDNEDYYSSTLSLLARVAVQEFVLNHPSQSK